MSGLFAPSAQDKYFHPSYCLPRPDDCSNLFLASLNHSSYNHIPFTYTERPWMTRNYLMNQTEKYFISLMFMNISGLVRSSYNLMFLYPVEQYKEENQV